MGYEKYKTRLCKLAENPFESRIQSDYATQWAVQTAAQQKTIAKFQLTRENKNSTPAIHVHMYHSGYGMYDK